MEKEKLNIKESIPKDTATNVVEMSQLKSKLPSFFKQKNNRLYIFVAVLAVLGSILVFTTKAATISGQIKGNNGMCIDNANNKWSSGNKIQIEQCNTDTTYRAQNWQISDDGTIRNGTKFCMDVRDSSTAVNATIELWRCSPNRLGQKWSVQSDKTIKNINSNLCLNVINNSVSAWSGLWLRVCDGNTAQLWQISSIDTATPSISISH